MIVYEEIFKKYGLSPTQQEIIKIVGRNETILEIGSSTGYMTKAFLDRGCIVDVVESDKRAVACLPAKIRKIFNQSVEDKEIFKKLGKYDFIIMADVLEHLVWPEEVLKRLLKIATSKTKLIISLPNIASWSMRKQLFFNGDFEYQQSGLLDKTHLHFYTVNALPKVLEKNGWRVKKLTGTITRFPFEGLISRLPVFGFIFRKILYKNLVNKFMNLSYYHFIVEASKA